MFRSNILLLSSGEKVIWSEFTIEKSFSYIGVIMCHLVGNIMTTEFKVVDEDTNDSVNLK